MFGGGSNSNASSAKTDNDSETDATALSSTTEAGSASTKSSEQAAGEKRSGNGSPPGGPNIGGIAEKKRRSSSVGSKASSLLASARNSLSFSPGRTNLEMGAQSPLQKLGKQDPALAVPQGQHNNSAGESAPGPNSTFRVGVWEDRNKKCRRTMEDTHSFLYNFLDAPAPQSHIDDKSDESESDGASHHSIVETDNGYFAIFDGHAGTFAADWCGKKVHIILEDLVRKYPNVALPQLLDQTFTTVDNLLEKLPLKNSGCTAAIAVLRWEARSSTERSATATAINMPQKTKNTEPKDSSAVDAVQDGVSTNSQVVDGPTNDIVPSPTSSKQRVLYTANVGDARIILCRNGKALRLSYDHKGSDENEGKRIANAGGLILNNRVNGVLAVTRALGDTYLKNLVTGHPYTTETVIQPEVDEFIIIACDGLWDVCSDQEAVDLVRGVQDPTEASKLLVEHALGRFSTDNLSCMIVRLNREAAVQSLQKDDEIVFRPNRASEADRIVMDTKQRIAEGLTPAVGISATNSGRGYDAPEAQDGDFVPTALDGTVEEEPNVLGELEIPEPKRDVVSTTEKLATPNKTERP